MDICILRIRSGGLFCVDFFFWILLCFETSAAAGCLDLSHDGNGFTEARCLSLTSLIPQAKRSRSGGKGLCKRFCRLSVGGQTEEASCPGFQVSIYLSQNTGGALGA